MIGFDKKGRLFEGYYEMSEEAKNATLLTTGNGYIGVRGSFEEFGTSRVQGAYVRGLLDEIVEIVEPFSDNEYMRKYYFDEEKLKEFDVQESCINFADFLLIRFTVGGKTFYPWEGKILKWDRYLDFTTETLVRKVRWDDGEGNVTDFTFERFASYHDEHIYCQRATAVAVNHTLEIKALAGIDSKVRTCGQKIVKDGAFRFTDTSVLYDACAGTKYGFKFTTGANVSFYGNSGLLTKQPIAENDYAGYISSSYGTITVEKTVVTVIDRDVSDGKCTECAESKLNECLNLCYDKQFELHLKKWSEYFACFDIKITGDDEADFALRYSNYHTAISATFNDSVHSLSAKGLTGEKYNQFVWWDCEIYQLPVFISTYPEAAKKALIYRHRLLEQSKKNAVKDGKQGAKFAFCSGVTGEELVWKYARHPFMQIHINSDIAFCVLNYYYVTGDKQFMLDYGMELLVEISRFWLSTVVERNNRYEILCVTGTDEHHPYVDNDAYTNYTVKYVLEHTAKLVMELGTEVEGGYIDRLSEVASKIYLPVEKDGMIPQFDGYFDLSKTLQVVGSGTGKGFQMKQSGLYHLSQIIKQPDVMLLYTLADVGLDQSAYARNWDYYEAMCESSSSLSVCIHAINSIDNDRPLSFYKYFMQTVRMDIDDLYSTAWQGMHSGCAAGAYMCILRGVMGIKLKEDGIYVDPSRMPFWKSVELNFLYKGKRIFAKYADGVLKLTANGANVPVICSDGKKILKNKLIIK